MSIFSRINDIVQANLNAVLDKAEDPEKLLTLIISEMEDSLTELRTVAAKHLAEQKSCQRKLDKLQKQADYWQEKATVALSKDREDLARAALVEKHKATSEMESIEEHNKAVVEQLEKLQEDSARLVQKLSEAKAKKKSMQTRFAHAQTRLNVKREIEQYDVSGVINKFDSYENKIDELEARVDAYDMVSSDQSLQAQFKEMEANDAIENELAELKKKVA
ncbi:MAG: phage shock protein PspA [Alteromonadaceae bacterium]|nr:phage shock protein PspA [Alteromonadaceae bacterium]